MYDQLPAAAVVSSSNNGAESRNIPLYRFYSRSDMLTSAHVSSEHARRAERSALGLRIGVAAVIFMLAVAASLTFRPMIKEVHVGSLLALICGMCSCGRREGFQWWEPLLL